MGIKSDLKIIDYAAQNLGDEQLLRLNAKLGAGSRRYAIIEIQNGNIKTFSELNSTATLVEDAKRRMGEASENVIDKKECSGLLEKRVKVIKDKIEKLNTIFKVFFVFTYGKRVLTTPQEVKEVAEAFEASHGKDNASLCRKVAFTQENSSWEICFRPDGIEVKKAVEEATQEQERRPSDENPLHSFMAFGENLKWSEEGGLEIDPSGNKEDTVKALHQALLSKSPFQLDDLCDGFLERVQVTGAKEADAISSHFIDKWVDDYTRDCPEDKETAKQFVEETFQTINRYDRKKILDTLAPFIKMYRTSDESLKPTLIKLSKYFLAEGALGQVRSVVEQKSQLLNNCLIAIAEKKDDLLLTHWLYKVTDNKHLSFADLKYFHEKIPGEWLIENLPVEVVDLAPPQKIFEALHAYPDFTDFYYKFNTGEIYDEKRWENQFPLENYESQADRYTVENLADVGYGDQSNYGALFHQTLLIGYAEFKEKKWDFPQLLSLLMLRRHRMALIQAEHGAKLQNLKNAGNLIFGNSGFSTQCYWGPYKELGNFFFSSLAEWERQKKHVTKINEHIYQLQGTLNGKTFEHSRLHIRSAGTVIYHTDDPKTRKEILVEVGKLFNQARQENDRKEFMRKIGLIYYWICQAKPFELGDPSIAEMVIRILCMEKDVELNAWDSGIIPWVEVMKHVDPEEFANKFHTFSE